MIDFVELLKVIGSASGLFATSFLLWDRYYKHFPIAIIVARPVMPGSVNVNHRLLLKNVSDRPILITRSMATGHSCAWRRTTRSMAS